MYKYYLEIKNRCFLLIFTWFFMATVCYLYKEIILFLFVNASKNSNIDFYFIFTDVTELLNVYFLLVFFISNQIGILMLFYHILTFFASSLYVTEYSKLENLFRTLSISWLISLILLYKFIIPFTWFFFSSFNQENNTNLVNFFFEAKIMEYFNFFVNLYYVCFISLQLLVLVLFFINSLFIKITQIKMLRKFFFFSFVLFSTIITPPDIISQIFLSTFFITCYEIVIFRKLLFKNF